MLDHFDDVHLSVSATTRSPRPGEVDGVDYYFVTPEKFDELVGRGEMLEYAVVHGVHKYGTPKQPVLDALAQGKHVILEIDIQGARQVKRSMPSALLIFIEPPSWQELVNRLNLRATESVEEQQARLETALVELASSAEFDAIVVNDDIAKCAHDVLDLMQA
jgi:guanylate kinase